MPTALVSATCPKCQTHFQTLVNVIETAKVTESRGENPHQEQTVKGMATCATCKHQFLVTLRNGR